MVSGVDTGGPVSSELCSRAAAAGIATHWTDVDGRVHEVREATLLALLAALEPVAGAARRDITVPFRRCPLPQELGVDGVFGIGCGLWSLRSEPDCGIGDFAALERLVERAAEAGCDVVELLPLHARFPADPSVRSPYAPSNRRFLDVFAIAPDSVPEVARSPHARRRLSELRSMANRDLVDHARAGRCKLQVLEAAFALFRDRELESKPPGARGSAFLAWRQSQGRALEDHCRFDALHAHMLARGGPWSFHQWPPELRRADSPAVEDFACVHADKVTFFAWLQWIAHGQLRQVEALARRRGMRLGIGRDLAVGLHPAGSAAWSQPDALVRGVSIGAPPDAFNPLGQNWGLVPFSPSHLLAHGIEDLACDFAANMDGAGSLRIDHVMGLSRQFWIPEGMSPADGTYVYFPFDAVASRLAEEARMRGCLVVGEDLGTVPPGFRSRMRRRGMLGIRVLWFERSGRGGFRPPARWPQLAQASITTHDLPTFRGFLEGRDISWRERLGILDAGAAEAERRLRARQVEALRGLLRRQNLFSGGAEDADSFAVAAHALLGRARSAVAMVRIEDLAGEREQPNLPGTVDEHPNWRRRLGMTVDALFDSPLAGEILEAVRKERQERRRREPC